MNNTRSTKDEVMAVLIQLSAAFKEPVDESRMEIYIQHLMHLSPSVLQGAANLCVQKCKFFPRVSELVDAAASIQGQDDKPTASESWGIVKRQMFKVGTNGDPDVDDVTWRTIEALGGWKNLCLSENEMSDRCRFLEAHEAISLRLQAQARLAPVLRMRLQTGKPDLQLVSVDDNEQ